MAAAIHLQAPAIVVLLFVLIYVACFAVGIGTGTWVVMSEICPTRVRGRAMSIATVFLWCGTLVVTLTFLSLVRVLTAPGAFLLYAVICIAAFLFVKIGSSGNQGTQPGGNRKLVVERARESHACALRKPPPRQPWAVAAVEWSNSGQSKETECIL